MNPTLGPTFAAEDDVTLVDDPGDEPDWEDLDDLTPEQSTHAFPHIPKSNSLDCPFIVVVDSSGIHHLPLLICTCEGSNQNIAEALAAGLLSSTFKDMKTAFTTDCLDDFRFANLECKTSAYQYYQMLKH